MWAGSDKGNVKCLRLEDIHKDGATLGTQLVVKGQLKWAGPGMPDVASGGSATGEGSWVDNKHFKVGGWGRLGSWELGLAAACGAWQLRAGLGSWVPG